MIMCVGPICVFPSLSLTFTYLHLSLFVLFFPYTTTNTISLYALTCVWFIYVEGYKGLQLKFSPLVVKRSFAQRYGISHPLHLLVLAYGIVPRDTKTQNHRRVRHGDCHVGETIAVSASEYCGCGCGGGIDVGRAVCSCSI